MKAGQERALWGGWPGTEVILDDRGMFTYSSLASSYSSLRTQLSHHLLQEDCLNCPLPPALAGLETPPLGSPAPLLSLSEHLLPHITQILPGYP